LTAETREAAAEFLFRNPVAPRKNPTNGANPSSNASERLELTGDEQRIAATLRAVWPLVPANWRPHCSFDTDFEGCNAAATRYWVTGQRGSDGGPRRDSSRREDNPTPYTTWVRWRIQDASALWTPQLRDAADRYCQLLGENAAVFPATDESLMSEIVTANRPLLRLLLVRGVRDAFRHHHIPSLRQRFDWCLRAWGRWLVPRWIVFLFSFFWNRRSRDELRSATADASDLTPLPEFANDVLVPLWASLADQCLASDSPATAFRLACGQETDGLRKRVAPRSVDEAPATRRWPDNQVTSSLRAAARQRRLPRHFEIREVIGRWVSRSDDRWLLVWFSGWSRGLAGGWLTGTWRRYGFRKLLSTLPVADRRDVVDALWRNDALGGGRSLRPAQAAKLRDRLLAE
jgi:hypothetical protein